MYGTIWHFDPMQRGFGFFRLIASDVSAIPGQSQQCSEDHPSIEAGDLYVVDDGSSLVATVALQWSDPMFWGERNDAGFIHRLGVRRSHAGLSSDILEWASAEALSRSRRYLCLDCLSTNHRLRRYYEGHGYSEVGQLTGPTDHAHAIAHGSWTAILYEKALLPAWGVPNTAREAKDPLANGSVVGDSGLLI